MTYTNQAGESIVITLYLIKDTEVKQINSYEAPIGSGTVTFPPFSCGSLSAGQYTVMFQVFKKSDIKYMNPIYSALESKTITC